MRARALIFFFVFISMTLIHLVLNSYIISSGYKTNDLTKQLNELRSRNRDLAAYVSGEFSLDRIEKKARQSLGMVYPEKVDFIIVSGEAESETRH